MFLHLQNSKVTVGDFDILETYLTFLNLIFHGFSSTLPGGNKVSSRSHLVVRVKLQFTLDGEGRNAVLDVVDLAGSERIRTDLDEETSKDHIAIQAGRYRKFRILFGW